MAQMGIYTGSHEIVEIEESSNPVENYGRNNFITPDMKRDEKDRSLASNDGNISSVEDDLNQLFEIFNRKASSHGSSHKNRAGSSKKNASKKPVKAAAVHSHGHGISERMNLKQAFRGLCLSQASETAAMKRSTKLPRSSEAGKILTMYRNVVVEDNISDHSQDDSREGMLEISLVPEQTTFDSFQSIPGKLPASDLWPSNRNSLTEMANRPTPIQSGRFVESEDSSNVSSTMFSHTDYNTPDVGGSILTQTQVTMTSSEIRNQTPTVSEVLLKQKQMLPPSSSPSAINSMREVPRGITRENGNSSAFVTGLSPTRKHAPATSPSSSSNARISPAQKVVVVSAVEADNHKTAVNMPPMEENSYAQSCFDDFHDQAHEHTKSATTENKKFPSADVFSTQLPLIESVDNGKHELLFSSPTSCGKSSLDMARKTSQQKERISTSPVAQNQKKFDTVYKEDHAHTRSPRRSNLGDKVLDHNKNGVSPRKVVNKEAAVIPAKVVAKEHGGVQDSIKTITSSESPKGKKVSRSTKNAQHLVKPLIKTKNFVKRRSKKKMATDNGSKNIRSEFNNDLYSSPNPIVCPRCQCDVTDALKETDKEYSLSPEDSPISPQESLVSVQESPASYLDSPISPFASLSGEVSSGNVVSDFSTPGPSSDGLSKPTTILVESSSNSKSRDRADFTQSSKTSPVGCSSSTSISEENNITRPSFCDRPHMSKDVRWEAIRHVRSQHGMLGLKNFSLLKKLGCGDIGTVYLAELIGTNCLFAIKVMDCEFLARRKKITRAQTEKEILRMLDHPFLPTLYCQFTSDNLSCLVMEYCPGGDLHVLRQKQPSRCFTEQAARFYVAEVLLALEYLHMLGVVYRDLKPENILVREDGHIMLSDFDLSLRCAVSPTLLVSSSTSEGSGKSSRPHARGHSRCVQPLCIGPSCRVTCFTPKLLSSSKSSKLKKMKSDVAAEMRPLLQLVAEPTSARSNSFVGTHEYLAPEIIKGEGHGSAVDWWTFGIFLYELLYGRTPFKGPGNEETLANVVLQNLKFPDSPFVSLQARDLIDALLVKEPENRLGTERGAAEIKQHPFFNGLNWALIRCAAPPEMPESHNYGMPKPVPNEKNNKSSEYSSGTASAEHLEFEVF